MIRLSAEDRRIAGVAGRCDCNNLREEKILISKGDGKDCGSGLPELALCLIRICKTPGNFQIIQRREL